MPSLPATVPGVGQFSNVGWLSFRALRTVAASSLRDHALWGAAYAAGFTLGEAQASEIRRNPARDVRNVGLD